MPNTTVDIDLSAEAGAIPQPTYSDLVIVGRAPDVGSPTYNEPVPYENASQVETDFGANSDVYASSQQVESMGADQWWVVMLEATAVTDELIDGSDSGATQSGTLANSPVRGGVENVTVELDGTEQDVVASTESPPQTPGSGEAAINFDTGEIETGDQTSGSSSGIVVDYEHLSWSDAFTNMSPLNFDLAILADTRADESYIGELDELVEWASGNSCSVVAALENGNNYTDDQAAMDAAHSIGSYVSSGNLMTVAHKSSEDVSAGIAGRLSVKHPWFDPFYDGAANYNFATDYYRQALVGNPSQNGTFEGGDSGGGTGPTNVLINAGGSTQVLSNSLTTAGGGSDYEYFDVKRTENFVRQEISDALQSLRLRRDQIPFTNAGRTLIDDAIAGRLYQHVAERNFGSAPSGRPLVDLSVHVPRVDDLPDDDRANRIWSGIQVEGTLASNVHEFSLELTVQV